MAWQTILYDVSEQIATITLNRPEKRNAQSTEAILELDEAFREAERDPDVRVVILTGAGPAFCAGHDLSFWKAPTPEDTPRDIAERAARANVEARLQREQTVYYDKLLAIRNLKKPTIAQVHGKCIAAGAMLAAMCDIIYASEDATFANPVLHMANAAAEVLFEPWDLGPRQAKEFLFTAEPISAQDAFRLGLVNKVVPREKIEEEVIRLAQKIVLTPPLSLRLTKESINRTMDIMGQTQAWQQHFVVHQLSHASEENARFREAREKAGGALKDQLHKYQKGTFGS